jgi:hypothetical protein
MHKKSTYKIPYFPRKNANPPSLMDLKTAKTHSPKTEQQIPIPRKTPIQTAFMPEKCSTIHPQQFPRGPVKSDTSSPRIVQKFHS